MDIYQTRCDLQLQCEIFHTHNPITITTTDTTKSHNAHIDLKQVNFEESPSELTGRHTHTLIIPRVCVSNTINVLKMTEFSHSVLSFGSDIALAAREVVKLLRNNLRVVFDNCKVLILIRLSDYWLRISTELCQVQVKIRGYGWENPAKICENLKSIKLSRKMCDDSVVAMTTETFSGVAAKRSLGECVRAVLEAARDERRLTVGLLPAVRFLSGAGSALFCLTAAARRADSASHMRDVLLRAFCDEHGIHTLELSSEEELKRLMGCSDMPTDLSCVLVHAPYTDPFSDSREPQPDVLSPAERALVALCEAAVVKLPEK